MTAGKFLLAIGLVLVIVGSVVSHAPGLLNWFGKLPGDIRIETEHSFVSVPITSMLLVSIVLSLIVNLFFRRL